MSIKTRLTKLEGRQPKLSVRPKSLREFYGEAPPLEEDYPYPHGTIKTLAYFYSDERAEFEEQLKTNIERHEKK